ncbi:MULTISPECIES: hypothetical protein [unclassified Arthrobacter]|uniref:hypothetical protein n=1 Tax=unclassified Arthrobacter TaxID=235627 RepID=UPI0014909F68|nr:MULTISPECIES: hypothetical protein [unclassified Arthrobacter]MBE0009755.1 hypothetical protein [Arthrobacter sp. AET 35A]NOJ63553.1 hypothetical protein [Arthrobacter sp. 147(2020)]
MSPKSRIRKPKSAGKDKRNSAASNTSLVANTYRRVAPFFAYALDQTSSLESEQLASNIYSGMHQTSNLGPGIDSKLFDEWIRYLERQESRAAAAILWAMAQVADAPGDAQAAAAAERLTEAGVAPPAWLEPVRKLEATEAWMMTDVFGDSIELVVEFRTGRRKHGMHLSIDTNHLGGYAINAGFSTSARHLLKALERLAGQMQGMMSVASIGLPEARKLGLAAIGATDITADPQIDQDYHYERALVLKRLQAMPGGEIVDLDSRRVPSDADEEAQGEADEAETQRLISSFMAHIQRDTAPASSQDFRDQFLRLADLAISFGRFYDDGRLVRVSPVKMETFISWFLPRKTMLDSEELEALPWFLYAWIDWCGARMGLNEAAKDLLVDTVGEVLEEAEEISEADEDMRSPGMNFLEGLELADLEEAQDAMARRQLAMPYYGTWVGDVDYPQLNANIPGELRTLVLGELKELHAVGNAEYPGAGDPDGSPVWVAALRELVVAQLWNGEPRQVWEAAQRLQSKGLNRQEILDRLQSVLADHVDASLYRPAAGFGTTVDLPGYVAALSAVGAGKGRGGHLRSV